MIYELSATTQYFVSKPSMLFTRVIHISTSIVYALLANACKALIRESYVTSAVVRAVMRNTYQSAAPRVR